MALAGTIVAGLLVALLFYQGIYCLYLVYFHPLASYPGPGLARFTNYWRLRSFLNGNQHLVDLELHARYGRFVRDGPNSLLVSDLDAFKSIYGFTGKLNKGDFYAVASNGTPEHPNLFAARTEAQHRAVRKRLAPTAYAPKHLAQYEASVADNVFTFLETLKQLVKAYGHMLNIAPICERMVFDALIEATYGSSMGLLPEQDPAGIIQSKKKAFPFTFGISHIPWLSRLVSLPSISPFFRRPKYDKHGSPKGLSAAGAWTRKIMANVASGDAHLNPCILKNLLEIAPSDDRKMSLEAIRYECFNVIFAGTGSTAAALIAVLYEIGLHPGWQSRLRSDLERLPPTDYLSAAHLSRSESLQAVIKESLRLHPPFVGPFERVIVPQQEDTVANVKPLPAGTRIWSSLFVMCRSEQVFGDKIDEFRPERWMELEPDMLKGMDDMFCVFGRGSRRCIGQDLAWMTLQKTVAAVVRTWDLQCGEEALKGKAHFEMEYDELRVTLAPIA